MDETRLCTWRVAQEKTIWLRDIIRQNFKLGSDLQRFHQAPFDVRFDIYKTSSSCLKSGSMDTAV
jgi:hypothetical protein